MACLTTVIPVYNGGLYLYETLDALTKCTLKPDRVIIQDNCSTDNTEQVYKAFQHLGYEWRQNKTHVNVVANFNEALNYASETKYLHILCSDDVVLPRLFEELIPPIANCPDRALAYSAFAVINEKSELITEGSDLTCHVPVNAKGTPYHISLKAFLKRQADLYSVMLPAAVLKTDYQAISCKFSQEYLSADTVFLAHWGLACTRIMEVPQVLCHYRRHTKSCTNQLLKTPDILINDEWNCITAINKLLSLNPVQRWIRQERNKCYFAARSHVKLRLMKDQGEAILGLIRDTTRKHVILLHWMLGGLAVSLRELRQPKRHRTSNAAVSDTA